MATRERPATFTQIIDSAEIIPIEYSYIVDNVQNINHRMLCDQTRENIIIWLVRHYLLRNSYKCICSYVQCTVYIVHWHVHFKSLSFIFISNTCGIRMYLYRLYGTTHAF